MDETPSDQAQIRVTDDEIRIVQTNNTGWDDGNNAHASVDEAGQFIMACDVTDATTRS